MENLHILDLIRDQLVSSYPDTDLTKSSTSNDIEVGVVSKERYTIPCVTMLLEAVVKF